jgi:hypothetical protein
MAKAPLLHFHLITAEIVFRNKDDETGQIFTLRLNGVLQDAQQSIPYRLLGKAQQIVQMHFHQRMADQPVEVVDVILMGFSYLGRMTEEEFLTPPEGTKLQEKTETIKDPMLSH